MKIEKTLLILKPDTIARGIVGEVLSRFERAGLKLVGMKFLLPDKSRLENHYEGIGKLMSRKGKEIYDNTVDYMASGPVLAVVLEGVEAVEVVRKLTGSTEPKTALPGTIRSDYSHVSYEHANESGAVRNIVHASATREEADLEIAIWFDEDDILDYLNVHQAHTF
ncbi:nucleoside-diphosphate kinase [Candidatus Saccharibacteria bacterium]|jgi:nucleoside-diphosphate kinase|nr:nucleoside-diphosphate kinase [Candidatus Saccharibacteria bacterium]